MNRGQPRRIPIWNRLVFAVVLSICLVRVESASGPIQVSENGRYFVDEQGKPFYFLADTQWELFRRYSLADTRLILENRKAKGFSVVMVMLTGVGPGTEPNVAGEKPWINNDPASPNPAYFEHVDAVLKLARENDLQLLIGIYHQTYGARMTLDNARPWAAWVTSRYRDVPNIVWTLYPKANEGSRPLIARLAEGIQEGDRGKHVVSMHPDPSPASSSFMHEEPWLSFNSIQVWKDLRLIYPMTLRDCDKLPPKPATMLEGVYEKGEEYGYPITPLLVRREGYYTCMAGGFHGYGHNHSWRVRPAWREALDDPGARQMTVLKDVFTGLPEWWTLIPDQTVFNRGGNIRGDALNLAARSTTGQWLVCYLAGEPNVGINMSKLAAGKATSAAWINPATGDRPPIETFTPSETRDFSRPAGWDDALLVIRSGRDVVESKPITTPLRAAPNNPNYFADGTGKAVYLTGSHTWNDFQDWGTDGFPQPFDFEAYVKMLVAHHHNFTLLWQTELPVFRGLPTQGNASPDFFVTPQPWPRTGPGNASDGKLKFDLAKFNQGYFERLRDRVRQLNAAGIYAGVYLFSGEWLLRFRFSGDGYPLTGSNNVNGIDDGGGTRSATMSAPNAITDIQDAYVRKLIDTLNDLPNVLWIVSQEAPPGSAWWNSHLISLTRAHEAAKPLQHPIGYGVLADDNDATILNSDADWIAPAARISPTTSCGSGHPACKVNINDSDHSYFGMWNDSAQVNRNYFWINFTQGNQTLFMDPYVVFYPREKRNLCPSPVHGISPAPDPRWDNVRDNMGYIRGYADRLKLAAMTPRRDLSSTKHALASTIADRPELLVYAQSGGTFTVNLSGVDGVLAVEWMEPATGAKTPGGPVSGGATSTFTPPFNGDAVLYLRRNAPDAGQK
jgi:Protein of unknown function (DUF4038)/Putative collagen-binding domain of a collagenase